MLILSRKQGESLCFSGEIEIEILEKKSTGEVSIGIKAPKHVDVWRKELDRDEFLKRRHKK